MAEQRGVVFRANAAGTRSTSAVGRAIASAALAATDPVGSRAALQETDWRHGYVAHFRRLVEAGLTSGDAARTIAADGLACLHEQMEYVRDGRTVRLSDVVDESAAPETFGTTAVTGTGAAERELSLPYHGTRLRGDALHRRLDRWVVDGILEPSAAESVREVIKHPDWLDLSDHTVVVLGAGAEMGPLRSILRWGGQAVAIDLPRPEIWNRLLGMAREHAGTMHVPVPPGASTTDLTDLARLAGADLVHDLDAVTRWVTGLPGSLVLGNYVYADGATNVRVSTAVDLLTAHVLARRAGSALATLATPTDVFAVPVEVVANSTRSYERSGVSRLLRPAVRVLSGGRLLTRNYAPGANPGICDSLVTQQGPNYVLAKRLQRWRATTARAQGATVSMRVAPPTRTRSVLKNRALAAAYAGAHRFGVEVFEPATSNTLMAALLVHDLRVPKAPQEHPWQDEAFGAVHGGLWRIAYAPRSALGLAVVLGSGPRG